MANCKDCIHYRICLEYLSFIAKEKFDEPPFPAENAETTCEHFKDRSRSADLPCKVGEYLYRPDRLGIGKYLVVGIQLLKSNRIDIAWKLVDGVGIPIPYISAEDIGKTVFLTREEAEITLEEWKHDGNL